MATQTATQKLQHLLSTTEGLRANSSRDDYGRTVWDYAMHVKTADGYRYDHLVVVNLPKSWTEKHATRYMVNTAPARYNEGSVEYFINRAEAHLFAANTLLARWAEETTPAEATSYASQG